MALAIFDLDNTLLNGDSDHAWGEFMVNEGIVDGGRFKEMNDYFFQQYQNGSLDIYEYQEFALAPLTQHSLEALHGWRSSFVKHIIEPKISRKSRELLENHRQKGDFLLIITATNLFVTEPIANLLNVDHIIATEPEMKNGRYTGKVDGIPSFQHGKVERLNQWLSDQSFSMDNSYFYSDSHNDLPLLELVDNPVAVDPDVKLEKTAKSNNWPIISLID